MITSTSINNNSLNTSISNVVKHKGYFTVLSDSCNTSDWTLFINQDYSPNIKLKNLIINYNNNHLTKILINDEVIIEEDIYNLYNLFDMKWEEYNIYYNLLRIIKNKNKYGLILNFDSIVINNIKVYQKRRTGSGNLSINEFFINYEDI